MSSLLLPLFIFSLVKIVYVCKSHLQNVGRFSTYLTSCDLYCCIIKSTRLTVSNLYASTRYVGRVVRPLHCALVSYGVAFMLRLPICTLRVPIFMLCVLIAYVFRDNSATLKCNGECRKYSPVSPSF